MERTSKELLKEFVNSQHFTKGVPKRNTLCLLLAASGIAFLTAFFIFTFALMCVAGCVFHFADGRPLSEKRSRLTRSAR